MEYTTPTNLAKSMYSLMVCAKLSYESDVVKSVSGAQHILTANLLVIICSVTIECDYFVTESDKASGLKCNKNAIKSNKI